MNDTIHQEDRDSEKYHAAMDFIRALFQGNSDGHGFDHSVRVYRNAMKIAETEAECDHRIVALAALLHDTDDDKLFSTENNANARSFLETQDLPAEMTERICEAINAVSFHKNRGKKPETLEGRIVQDADRLDAIGAVGIGRAFAYGGAHGRSLAESIDHFHEKLLLLKDELNTESARCIAETRHAFLESFLEEWKKETENLGERESEQNADR